MEYKAIVEKDSGTSCEYNIKIAQLDRMKIGQRTQNYEELDSELTDKINMAVESSRLEYEHSFRRAERCDNKVYILLTVFGFIFILLTSSINIISKVDIWDYNNNCIIRVFDVVLVLSVVATLILLVMLVYSLTARDFKRYDTFAILENNLLGTADRKTLARLTIMKYEMARDYNDRLVSQQYKRLKYSVFLLIGVVILLMMLSVISNFVPKTAEGLKTVNTEIYLKEGNHERVSSGNGGGKNHNETYAERNGI